MGPFFLCTVGCFFMQVNNAVIFHGLPRCRVIKYGINGLRGDLFPAGQLKPATSGIAGLAAAFGLLPDDGFKNTVTVFVIGDVCARARNFHVRHGSPEKETFILTLLFCQLKQELNSKYFEIRQISQKLTIIIFNQEKH